MNYRIPIYCSYLSIRGYDSLARCTVVALFIEWYAIFNELLQLLFILVIHHAATESHELTDEY